MQHRPEGSLRHLVGEHPLHVGVGVAGVDDERQVGEAGASIWARSTRSCTASGAASA